MNHLEVMLHSNVSSTTTQCNFFLQTGGNSTLKPLVSRHLQGKAKVSAYVKSKNHLCNKGSIMIHHGPSHMGHDAGTCHSDMLLPQNHVLFTHRGHSRDV